jgi:HEAT repeat protein
LLALLLLGLAACGTEAPEADPDGPDPNAGESVEARIVYYDELGERGAVENIPLLERAIGRDHVEVQLTVIEALRRIGSPEALPALERAAGDELSRVRMNVAVAAGAIRSPETLGLLERLYRDPAIKVRRAAAKAVAGLALPEAVPLLMEMAESSRDENVRRAAVQGLSHVGPPAAEAIPLLVGVATLEQESIRWDAVEAMRSIGGEEASRVLQEQIGSDLPEIRGRAALALAELGSSDSLPLILDALLAEESDVARASMARAAALLGEREISISTLELLLLGGDKWAARVESAIGLGESGDQGCVPALQEAGADPNSLVRQRAAEAIKLIRSREAAS